MGSDFRGPIEGGVVVAAPHCGPGGTMNFHLGESTLTDDRKRKREPFSTVPFSRDPDFVDRPDILAWVREKCGAPAGRAAFVGLGGIGKSQLAIQYCYDVQAASPQTWIFWVHASTKARFEEAYRNIADRLELPSRNDPKVDTLKLVKDWLCDERNGQWIIILDNVDDVEVFYPKRKRGRDDSEDMPAPLAAFLPQSYHGSILVTSRSKDAAVRLVGSHRNVKEVHPMNEDQAIQLLQNKVEDTSSKGGMADLIRALDRVPLAISQAAAYINRAAPRMTVLKYLEDFWKNDKKKSNLLNKDTGDLRRDESASNAVVTTWQISFEQVRKERPSAADLLSLMSFFDPQGIPGSVLYSYPTNGVGICKGDDDDDDGDIGEDLDMLRAYSLVTATAESDVYEMHHLVQFCTRVWLLSFNEMERWRQKFMVLVAKEFPSGNYENWIKCQALLPHVEPMFEQDLEQKELLGDWAQMLTNAAWYMWTKGLYEKAENMAVRAIKTGEKVEGQAHPSMLTSVSILGLVLRDRGKYKAAEEMSQRALEGCEKMLGKEHPSTLTSVSNLALILQYQGKYEAVEEMNRRALEGREKMLGKEHSDTVTSVSDLALILQYQGKYEAAEEMNRRALEGYEKVLGKEHPNTLTSVSNLASVLQYQGKYEAAEEMNQRVLEGYEKVLGKEHPSTLTSVNNLASVLQYQGKYEAAEEMERRALNGREKALGKEHPGTLTSVNNLALMLRYQGKYEAAEEMNRRALEGYEKVLGKEHPDTLTSVDNLASVLRHQAKYEAAEEMNRRALEGKEKVLGKEHPDTLISVNNLALVLQDQGKYEAAEDMNQRALEGREKVLGKEHPNTLTSVSNLASVLWYQGKYEVAEEMNRRALEGSEKVLGKEHPNTLTSVSNLASVLWYQGKYEAAEEMNRRALEGREKVLGKEYPNTLTSVSNLASVVRY